MILPLLLVSFLTSNLVKLVEKNSIYFYELVEKGFLRRPRTDARILTDIRVKELLEKDVIPIHPEMRLGDVIPIVIRSSRNFFPVLDRSSQGYLGMVDLHSLKPYLFDPHLKDSILVEEVMQIELPRVSVSDSMLEVLHKFDLSQAWSLPVTDGDRFVGLVSKSRILDHYRTELKAQTED